MKDQQAMLAFFAAFSQAANDMYHVESSPGEPTPEEIEIRKERSKIERLKKQGVNEYYYENNKVYARSKKNADKKARRKGYL